MVKDMELLEEKTAMAQTLLKAALSEKAKLEATLEVKLQSSGSLRATIQSLQSENSALKSDLLSARAKEIMLCPTRRRSPRRGTRRCPRKAWHSAKDQAISRLEQAIEEKKWAIKLQDSTIEERREAVERIEELHLQVVELERELSQVPEL